VPLTAWGEPDLMGIWTSQTITPLERPAEFAGKEFLSEAEAAAFERDRVEARNQDRRDGPVADDVARAYNEFWWDRGTTVVPTRRTSLIVDSAKTTAEVVREVLRKRNALRTGDEPGTIRLMATDSPQRFARVAANLMPEHPVLPEEIELIDL
jgi:hypothetical protein